MNFDDLQTTWAQQTVAGERVDVARLRADLAREVRQRSRTIRRIIGVATFAFVMAWMVSLAAHFTGIKPFNRVTLLTFLTVSAFELGCLVVAVRALRRMRTEELSMGETLASALQTSLRAAESQVRDCRFFGYALVIEFAAEVGGTLLFYFTGNLPRHGMWVKVALSVALVAGIAATVHRYYRRRLVPRQAELRRQLADLQAGGQTPPP